MKTKILIIGLLILQLLPLKAWIYCKNFFDFYHFTVLDLELQLIYAINHDQGLPVILARIFHNKLLQFFIDIYKRYTHFLDPQLLVTLLTFVGLFGIIISIWYFLNSKKRNKKIGALILISFGIPLLDVVFNFKLPFIYKLLLVAVPFNLVSIYGHFRFLGSDNKKVVMFVYIVLIALSIYWIFMAPGQAVKYCEMP